MFTLYYQGVDIFTVLLSIQIDIDYVSISIVKWLNNCERMILICKYDKSQYTQSNHTPNLIILQSLQSKFRKFIS